MAILDDLKRSIALNRKLSLLLDSWIGQPRTEKDNPLVTFAIRIFGKERVEAMVIQAVKDYLPEAIRQAQPCLCELNTEQGRKYLHQNLDEILNYLVSKKYQCAGEYTCPRCHRSFMEKKQKCPNCRALLKW